MRKYNRLLACLLNLSTYIIASIGVYACNFTSPWVYMLILSAILIWVPLSFSAMRNEYNYPKNIFFIAVAAGLCFTLSIFIPYKVYAVFLAAPWLLLAVYTFVYMLQRMIKERREHLFLLAAGIFLIVGASWAIAAIMEYRPLGFSKVIVLLTAAHFHFAGFMLMYICSYLQLNTPTPLNRFFAYLAMLAMPLTAAGITLTHYTQQIWLETIGGVMMAIGGGGLALSIIKLDVKNFYHQLFRIGGLCLLVGMGLAFLYAIRPIVNIAWLDIPFMYSTHGTLNAAGLGMLILGIYFQEPKVYPGTYCNN